MQIWIRPCFEGDMLSDTGKELDRPEASSCTVLSDSTAPTGSRIQPNRLGQLVLFMVALVLNDTMYGELISGNHPDDAILL